jgi:hypothetical protein
VPQVSLLVIQGGWGWGGGLTHLSLSLGAARVCWGFWHLRICWGFWPLPPLLRPCKSARGANAGAGRLRRALNCATTPEGLGELESSSSSELSTGEQVLGQNAAAAAVAIEVLEALAALPLLLAVVEAGLRGVARGSRWRQMQG